MMVIVQSRTFHVYSSKFLDQIDKQGDVINVSTSIEGILDGISPVAQNV